MAWKKLRFEQCSQVCDYFFLLWKIHLLKLQDVWFSNHGWSFMFWDMIHFLDIWWTKGLLLSKFLYLYSNVTCIDMVVIMKPLWFIMNFPSLKVVKNSTTFDFFYFRRAWWFLKVCLKASCDFCSFFPFSSSLSQLFWKFLVVIML